MRPVGTMSRAAGSRSDVRRDTGAGAQQGEAGLNIGQRERVLRIPAATA
jgi:hypothetical protein